MGKRIELQKKLEDILGSKEVYFQAPDKFKRISYPCIIYNKAKPDVKHADNKAYLVTNCYELQVIYCDPDEDITLRILAEFSMCSPGKTFKADNLHHDNLTLYF